MLHSRYYCLRERLNFLRGFDPVVFRGVRPTRYLYPGGTLAQHGTVGNVGHLGYRNSRERRVSVIDTRETVWIYPIAHNSLNGSVSLEKVLHGNRYKAHTDIASLTAASASSSIDCTTSFFPSSHAGRMNG